MQEPHWEMIGMLLYFLIILLNSDKKRSLFLNFFQQTIIYLNRFEFHFYPKYEPGCRSNTPPLKPPTILVKPETVTQNL